MEKQKSRAHCTAQLISVYSGTSPTSSHHPGSPQRVAPLGDLVIVLSLNHWHLRERTTLQGPEEGLQGSYEVV